MKRIKYALGSLAILVGVLAIFFVLKSENTLIAHPKGIIALCELKLMTINTLVMLIAIVPTCVFLFIVAWKYRAKNTKAEYKPELSHGGFRQLTLWIIPLIVSVAMAIITWGATHRLDPYKPLESEIKPMKIQVVALDWKWLFIYPQQGIATLNFVQFPEQTPIHFELSGDGCPMNSFWIPQLSGQIYAMTGMTTSLHMMADGVGVYAGRAAEINGKGLADMTFVAKSSSQGDFDAWVQHVRQSPLQLTDRIYNELVKRSQNNPVVLYSQVEEDFFNKIVMKYQ